MSHYRIAQQLEFIVDVDKLKQVLRRTSPIGAERRENSAEHSWQVVLCALLLHEHANESVDLLRVVQMLAIHDTVEVDVGDTFHYDKHTQADLSARENAAAERIFALLPSDQHQLYLSLWREFEARETPEARYAAAIDRAIAFVMNFNNKGGTWQSHNLTASQILERNRHIAAGSVALWDWVTETVQQGLELGYINQR
jgi:putative hydrolase of HD superfamily